MSGTHRDQSREFSEESESLWRIAFAPSVWAVHFVICYAASAVWCSKGLGDVAGVSGLRLLILATTVIALAGIVWLELRAWRQWRHGGRYAYFDELERVEDRHRFLGHAAFLLGVISFVGVIYVALPALLVGTCA